MPFINDLTASYAWATPAPIGWVERGWVTIVEDLVRRVDGMLSADPNATLDIIDVSARGGILRFAFDVGGPADPALAVAVHDAVAEAEARSRTTCPRSGRPRPIPVHDRPTASARRVLPHAWAFGR